MQDTDMDNAVKKLFASFDKLIERNNKTNAKTNAITLLPTQFQSIKKAAKKDATARQALVTRSYRGIPLKGFTDAA